MTNKTNEPIIDLTNNYEDVIEISDDDISDDEEEIVKEIKVVEDLTNLLLLLVVIVKHPVELITDTAMYKFFKSGKIK